MTSEVFDFNHIYDSNKTRPQDSVELKAIESLGFVRGRLVKSRRFEPTPQLECLSSPIDCQNADIDYVHCHNMAFMTESPLVFWDCKATVPEHYEIYSTKVDCEGYNHPGDSYVLKGSCGLKYQVRSTLYQGDFKRPYKIRDQWAKYGFILMWISIAFFILFKLFRSFLSRSNRLNHSSGPRSGPREQSSNQRVTSHNTSSNTEIPNHAPLRQRDAKLSHDTEEILLSSQELLNENEIISEAEDGYLYFSESSLDSTTVPNNPSQSKATLTSYISPLEPKGHFASPAYKASPYLRQPRSHTFYKRKTSQSFIATTSTR
ncbi:hypothetical protein DSO57_1017319 [Entomophthora muscae]|uniref:Uncharacterized protein n=1 Tax=Entomophthora muscae TaxID=34485 RepID=A0ACC2S6N0_9FUNG|nr:hypothetical protein DSO57_1017319 [Entomophthora muscae]